MSTPSSAPGPWGPQPGRSEPSRNAAVPPRGSAVPPGRAGSDRPGGNVPPRPAGSGGRGGNCPDCGRPVPPFEVKLCPACGYPLLLEHEPTAEAEPHKLVYKPESATEDLDRSGVRAPTPTAAYTAPQPTWTSPPTHTTTAGPNCPQCRTVNPAHRKRCEICGYELWPGAASPPRWQPDPPPMPAPAPRRRNRWRWVWLIGGPAAVMVAVWVLALVL